MTWLWVWSMMVCVNIGFSTWDLIMHNVYIHVIVLIFCIGVEFTHRDISRNYVRIKRRVYV